MTRVDLLVIDDFGLKPLSLNQDEDFHDVVAERYEQHPTIITSNLDFEEWGVRRGGLGPEGRDLAWLPPPGL
ncbi:hypothetical protein C3Y92_20205 (plasmid) [Solidesulfovibrio carbinolicus]|uniref:IstB-like ATP-binding domain-containing protein n=1 Tax=Solidesulfovibrio carbinolicus TaxID=296842 RepID=A0A4P6HQJ2_9BACT|nr:hypothetical protein C3Y92_20205 [Solidesulfovibrio carbinolicus]